MLFVFVADTRSRRATPLLHFRKLVWRTGSRSSRGPSIFFSWPQTRGASSPHQVCSPSITQANRSGSKTQNLIVGFLILPLRHDRHSFHRQRAKLPLHQDGGARPRLLGDHPEQLRRNRQPRGRLWPPAQPRRGPIQPQHPVPHAPRLHLLREFQGRFPGGVCFDPPLSKPRYCSPCDRPPPPLLHLPLLSDLSHQTIGYSPDPMEPAVGSAFPGFIWTCQNSSQCVIMPLSHQHNKVLYCSPTIAKALSLSSLSI